MSKSDLQESIEIIDFKVNGKMKKDFLIAVSKNRSETTTRFHISTLKKIDAAEMLYGRQWFDFSETMVDNVLMGVESKSKISQQSYLSTIKDYLDFVTPVDNNERTGYSYTRNLKRKDLDRFLNKIGIEYRYITPKEFYNVIKNSKIDVLCKSLFVLLYLGVKGDKFSDICNIKSKHVDLNNRVIKREDGSILCEIPEEYIEYFRQTIKAKTYKRYDKDGKFSRESELVGSPYFVKKRMGSNMNDDIKPNHLFLSKTITEAQKNVSHPYLTATSIYLSGIAYRLLQEHDMQIPTSIQLEEFKIKTNTKISYESTQAACTVLLEKLEKENSSQS